jgi:hypothetical protein
MYGIGNWFNFLILIIWALWGLVSHILWILDYLSGRQYSLRRKSLNVLSGVPFYLGILVYWPFIAPLPWLIAVAKGRIIPKWQRHLIAGIGGLQLVLLIFAWFDMFHDPFEYIPRYVGCLVCISIPYFERRRIANGMTETVAAKNEN